MIEEIRFLAECGDKTAALRELAAYLDDIGGPFDDTDIEGDPLSELNPLFTVWEQIDIYCGEVDKRPENRRSWKLLGYAYMCAGVYVPVLLYLAEHCLRTSMALGEDETLNENLENKLELIDLAKYGDKEARETIVVIETGIAGFFEQFPDIVPVPDVFYVNRICPSRNIEVNENLISPDFWDAETADEKDGEYYYY